MEQQQYHGDEISLKELILILWNGKKMIIGITIGCIILSIIYTFFIVKPVYEATSEIIVQPTAEVATRYGTYTFPSENPKDYINYIRSNDVLVRVIEEEGLDITIKNIKDKIKINREGEDTVRFLITTSSNTAESAVTINKKLIEKFILTQRIMYKRYAIEQFVDYYNRSLDESILSIESQERLLRERQELLKAIPPIYTLQKSLFSDPKTAAAYADKFDLDLNELSQAMLVEEYAKGVYLRLEEICINTEEGLIDSRESLYNTQEKLKDLKEEQKNIELALKNNDFSLVFNNKADVFKNKVIVASPAVESKKPIKPRKVINLIIGAVLGGILGVFITFGLAYWKNN